MSNCEVSRKDMAIGAAQVGLGGVLSYKTLEQALPRALGIRTEYHITTKENARAIKKMGNFLDPKCGGKNGWSAKIKSNCFVKNSTNYVHITGIHKDTKDLPKFLEKFPAARELGRRFQLAMYKVVAYFDNPDEIARMAPKEQVPKWIKGILFNNKTKTFYIPGVDSYFNKEFIPDFDDYALKTTNKLKCYSTRFGAMLGGLKKFGLKGILENKARAFGGFAFVVGAGLVAAKLIKSGIDRVTGKNKTKKENIKPKETLKTENKTKNEVSSDKPKDEVVPDKAGETKVQ